ncbi:PTPRV-like protein, partial [Mya arenaria]
FTAEEYSEKESQAIARNKTLKGKNRPNADIPGDGNRPRLNKGIKEGRSDYINAVFINSVGSYFPADNQVLKTGAFSVKSLRQDGKDYYTKRTLMLEPTGQNKETVIKSIPQLAFSAWDSSKNTPRSASEFMDFINYVEEASRASTSRGPILIHCIDGASKSGLFCVV